MAANALSGLTMNPNYHEFGPSQMENELAKIAAGQGGGSPGRAFAMGIRAHDQRLEDNQEYYNRLDAGDAARQGYAMQLGRQGQQTEQIKMLTEALKREGVPLGAAMRIAQGILGQQQTATPELDQSDENSNNLGMGKAIQAVGEGVDKLRAGGVGTSAMNPILQRILHGGIANVQPTSVEAAQVKADAEGKLTGTIQTGGFGVNGKTGIQVKGPVDQVMHILKTDPDYGALMPDEVSTLNAPRKSQTRTAPPTGLSLAPGGSAFPGLNNPPPMAPGTSVGPLSSATPDQTPGGPGGSDAAVRPEHYGTYQQVLSTAQQEGSQLGNVQPMGDGSLLIPEVRKGQRTPGNNIRIYKDPSGNYKSKREPL